MKIRTIYIDDDNKELKKFKKKFKEDSRTREKFELIIIDTHKEIKNLINEVKEKKPELFLVDFDLEKPKNGVLSGISGTSLSNLLREKFPDFPIVLFTRKSVFKVEQHPKQILASLDKIIYKSDFFNDGNYYIISLYELAIGFKKLRDIKSKHWNELLKIIKAPKCDYVNLKLANPPITSENNWMVSEIANWICNVLIEYPGILYNPVNTATFLGISQKAFLSTPLQEFFTDAKYSGIFNPIEGRWWKSKIQNIAEKIMNKKEKDMLPYEGFPLAWERFKKIKVERSKCIFSGESPADWVCCILNEPVMIKYSLSYSLDSRPLVMDEARVSFEALRTSNDVNDNLISLTGKEMLADIRKMHKPKERNEIED